jgi:hypothetical protein
MERPTRHYWGLIIAAVFGLAWPQAAAGPCDPSLTPIVGDPNGYRLRGDRCEGVYLQPLKGSAALMIASFTEAYLEFDARARPTLTLEWTSLEDSGPTRLRAHSLRAREYYRMDAERPVGTGSYSWPTTILGNLSLSRKSLGILAWNEVKVDQSDKRIHVPLRVGATPLLRSAQYDLVVIADVELTEIFLTLSLVNQDGQTREVYLKRQPLGYGYYPARQGIKIPISRLNRAGLHRLELGATQRDGASATAEFWFYHDDR